jgi:hypothetical protein
MDAYGDMTSPATEDKPVKWFECKEVWKNNVFALGFMFVGWCPKDHTCCIGFSFYKWMLIIGPHV